MLRQKAKFQTPHKPWIAENIERNNEIIDEYGLRRKKEVWRAQAILREWRRRARDLAASKNEKEEKILLSKLHKMGLIGETSNLDDVLGLEARTLFERRLQTLVFRKGFANSLNQARQFVVHGHIAVDGTKSVWPSMLIPTELEGKIGFYDKSKVKAWLMAAKAKQVEKEKEKAGMKETLATKSPAATSTNGEKKEETK